MPENQSPAPLFRLASNVILKSLRKAVIKIDAEFEKSYSQTKDRKVEVPRKKSKKKNNKTEKTGNTSDSSASTGPAPLPLQLQLVLGESSGSTSSTGSLRVGSSGSMIFGLDPVTRNSSVFSPSSSGSDTSSDASLKVALSIMKVKNYIRSHLTPEVQLALLHQGLTYSVMSKTIPLIRFLILKDIDQLDFCGTNFWFTKNTEPSSAPVPIIKPHLIKSNEKSKFKEHLSLFDPPNEFDWYSADRLGRPVVMNDVLELFSIIRSAQCGVDLKSLMVNGRRGNYYACRKDAMPIIEDACSEFHSLTKLYLRGMADDNLLKMIGKTVKCLTVLDVSCSKFVTDEGIRNIFYEEVVFTPVLYTIASYVENSVKTMNPIIKSLEYLDFSYTSVSNDTLTFIKLLPQAFIFKRLMVPSMEVAFGHVLFIRHPAVFSSSMQLTTSTFHKSLSKHLVTQCHSQFSKCASHLFWRNSFLTLHKIEEPSIIPNFKSRSENRKSLSIVLGIIIRRHDDKFIQGLVKFYNGNLTFFYNISSVSIQILGESCPKLEFIQTILSGTWTCSSSTDLNCGDLLWPNLTTVNIFAEPSTISSILEQCPNLVKVKFRVIWKPIKDSDIISSLKKSPSRITLEEFWIAPGSYQKIKRRANSQQQFSKCVQTTSRDNGNVESSAIDNVISATADTDTETAEDGKDLIGYGAASSEIEDNCKLSIECALQLSVLCTNLNRLGDLTWWSLASPHELAEFCQYIKEINSSLVIIFDDIILPDFEITHETLLEKESTIQ